MAVRMVLAVAVVVSFQTGEAWAGEPVLRPYYARSRTLQKARIQWKKGQLADALKTFDKAAREEKEVEDLFLIRFLIARVRYDAKQWDKAAAGFEALPQDLPALADWCRYYAGKARFENGEHRKAAENFAGIGAGSPLAREATELECAAYDKAGDAECARECAQRYGTRFAPRPELLLLEGKALIAEKKPQEATAVLRALVVRFPADSEANESRNLLKKLQKGGIPGAAELSAGELLEQARSWLARFRHTRGLAIAETLIDKEKQGSGAWCEAMALAARAQAGRREETLSLPYFRKTIDNCPDQLTDDFLFLAVDSARKAGKNDTAAEWTGVLLEKAPLSRLADDAMVLMARVHDRDGDMDLLRSAVDEILERYPMGDMATEAAWLVVFALYKKESWQAAYDLAAKYNPVLPPRQDYRTDGRLLYWMGRCLQKLGKKKDAVKQFTRVLEQYPLAWYGLLSYLRLEQHKKGLGKSTVAGARGRAKPTLPAEAEVLVRLRTEPRFQGVVLLLRMGLKDEARTELEGLVEAAGGTPAVEDLLLTAWLLDRAGMYSPSHHTLRRRAAQHAYAWPTASDDRWWKVAYPPAFQGQAAAAAKAHALPWPLVQGVMREESGFSASIESYAHALGLMQLLQKTASQMAGRKVTAAELKDPAVNVPLGAQYLRYLWDRFGHPALVVAGYNSGPGGVAKALARTGNRQVDEFVEHIPFDQTRRYTKRVLGAAWTYQVLYGPKGPPLIPFPLEFPEQKKP